MTIGYGRIRVSAGAVREELPDDIDVERINSAVIYVDEDRPIEAIGIEFSEKESNPKKRYAVQHPEDGAIHIGAHEPVEAILSDRVRGRYACRWDDSEDILTVDLTNLKKALGGE